MRFNAHCHLFKVIMELIVAFTIDGRKLCTGSRDNWMCLWDIESAKCEHRRNISRNLVSLLVYLFYLTVCLPMHTCLLAVSFLLCPGHSCVLGAR